MTLILWQFFPSQEESATATAQMVSLLRLALQIAVRQSQRVSREDILTK